VTASLAKVVRQLQLTAVGAFLERRGLQRMMAAAHVPLGRRSFSFRDSHSGTFNPAIKIATICAFSAGQPRGGGRIVANRALL
jgi:hypothetical protein